MTKLWRIYNCQLRTNRGTESNAKSIYCASVQVSSTFQRKVQSKIKDLLQQMEEGLKTADPHDFSTYTGWTGQSPVKMYAVHQNLMPG